MPFIIAIKKKLSRTTINEVGLQPLFLAQIWYLV